MEIHDPGPWDRRKAAVRGPSPRSHRYGCTNFPRVR